MADALPVVLTIAGSDSGAGAGIQADLKSITALGGYAVTAITAVTAQNTQAVRSLNPVSPAALRDQLEMLLADFPVRAAKTGMLANAALVEVVADVLAGHPHIPLVLDTPLASTSGTPLLDADGIALLRERLVPRATVLTPNRREAELLFGSNPAALLAAGQALLVTGGDDDGEDCIDTLYCGDTCESLRAPRIATRNSHGTGCTLSAAIAAGLARGFAAYEAVQIARRYVHGALQASIHSQLGAGHGPLDHFWLCRPFPAEEYHP